MAAAFGVPGAAGAGHPNIQPMQITSAAATAPDTGAITQGEIAQGEIARDEIARGEIVS